MTEPSLVFGKYQVVRRLAVGGMGEILLARQTGFDRFVILKALLPDLAENEESVARFLDEARLAATLTHPNIVAVYEVGQWEGTYLIVMEYIHGAHLGQLAKAAEDHAVRFPFEVSARIVHDAALALHHAHEWMAHRDVSRENVMVRLDGVTKVVDFGIAKAGDQADKTKTGVLKGKVRYLPPEALAGGTVDARGDQFGLGVVFWELLTGARMGGANVDVAARIAGTDLEAPSDFVEDVPPALEDLVLEMLDTEPSNRRASCRAVADALADYLGDRVGDRGLRDVASFVSSVAKERIEARTKDAPKGGDSFLLPLRPDDGEVEIATRTVNERPPAMSEPVPKRSSTTWALLALVLVIGVVLLARPAAEQPRSPVDGGLAVTVRDAGVREVVPPPPKTTSTATVAIVSRPSGATVIAGRTVLGTTPLETTALASGAAHELRLELPGHRTERLTVSPKPGETTRYDVPLAKLTRPPPPPKPAFLTIRTKPWSEVELDGKPVGTTPIFKIAVEPGTHRLRFSRPDRGVLGERTVEARPGTNEKLSLTFD